MKEVKGELKNDEIYIEGGPASEYITRLRNMNQVPQYMLSKFTGITVVHLSYLENRKRKLTVHMLEKILAFFEVTLHLRIGHKDDTSS